MSTTVSYKGNTIATVDNNTKTLTTQGKYCEANIILTDVSGGGGTYQSKTQTFTPSGTQQTATITPDAGYDALDEVGITVNAIAPPWYDMSGDLAWMGKGAELVGQNFYKKVDTLDNTLLNGWSPSTTAKAIVASVTLSDAKFTATNADEYVYYIFWDCGVDVEYTGSPTLKALPTMARACIIQALVKRPGSWANIQSGICDSTVNYGAYGSSFLQYYGTTTGSLTYTYAAPYGLYFGATAPTISSASAVSPTITPKTPTLSAKTSNTYMSATSCNAIDQGNSKWWILGSKIYRAKRDSFFDGVYKALAASINATPPTA